MNTDPINLHGVADLLGVGFFRARRWRDNAINGRGNERSIILLKPDVSDLPGNPLWSPPAVIAWATPLGLWPPKIDQYVCGTCHGTYSLYSESTMELRPHGWTDNGDGNLVPCDGSFKRPAGRARELEGATT